MIFFEDISKQKRKLDTQIAERESQLRSDVVMLWNTIKNSLNIPDVLPIDVNGKKLPYVYVGMVNDSGLMQMITPSQLKMDRNYSLDFYFCFLTDENVTSGSYCYVPIQMWYDDGTLYIDSGKNPQQVALRSDKTPHEVHAAAEVIKQSCIDQLTDVRLF